MKITVEKIQKLKEVLSHGLVRGLGAPEPGKMCVEAAVCFAFGLPHSDNPPCVGYAIKKYKINLNDKNWNSNIARANGMKRLAIAQLGSEKLDQFEFVKKLAIKTVNVLIYNLFKELKYSKYILDACKKASAANSAAAAGFAAATAATASADFAANSATAAAANSTGFAAADFAADFAATVAGFAASAANSATAAADFAANSADAAGYTYATNKYLKMSADIATNILIEMKSEGSNFLYLVNE